MTGEEEMASRNRAREARQTTFVALRSCKSGHEPIRLVSNGRCVECVEKKVQSRIEPARKQAASVGLQFFVSAHPCANGHIERQVSNGKCRTCVAAYNTQYYQTNRDRELNRRYEYVEENPNNVRVTDAKSRIKRRAKRRVEYATWVAKNWQKKLLINTQWRRDNPDKLRIINRNSKARRKSAAGHHSLGEVLAIFKKQSGKCAYFLACGNRLQPVRNGFHVDHIEALARGGTNYIRNIQLCCATCNLQKGAKDPISFARQKGLLI